MVAWGWRARSSDSSLLTQGDPEIVRILNQKGNTKEMTWKGKKCNKPGFRKQ